MTGTEYPWMENVCYEPRPLAHRSRLTPRIFLTLCALAVIGGALFAISN